MKPVFLALGLILVSATSHSRPVEPREEPEGRERPSLYPPIRCEGNVGGFSYLDTLEVRWNWIDPAEYKESDSTSDPDFRLSFRLCAGEPGQIPHCARIGSSEEIENLRQASAPGSVTRISGDVIQEAAATSLGCAKEPYLLVELKEESLASSRRLEATYVRMGDIQIHGSEVELGDAAARITVSKK